MSIQTNNPFVTFEEARLLLDVGNIGILEFEEFMKQKNIITFRDCGKIFFKAKDIYALANKNSNNSNSNIITVADIDSGLAKTREMIFKRIEKHGNKKFRSPAEALGTLVEEYHETIDEARNNNNEKFCDEMIDVAVTGIVAYISLSKKNEV